MGRDTYIFAGGGTGGHLCPGLAVAEELTNIDPQALVVFACSNRPIDRKILDSSDCAVVPQPVRPLYKNPLKLPGFLRAWRRSNALARNLIADLKPRAVLGLGGFAAGPMVNVAGRLGLPTAMLNPDAIPGKANRYLSRRVDKIFTQFECTSQYFVPEVQERIEVVGCPVRRHLCQGSRAEAMEYFGLLPERKVLLVFGGSTLAESITDSMIALAGDLDEFADDWQVLIAVGAKKIRETKQAFNARAIHARVLEYFDRMDLAYAAADLAVCRGGAGTVAELVATGTAAVILPYPWHADRQQYYNTADLVQAGGAILVEDSGNGILNAESLRRDLLNILRDAETLQLMQDDVKTAHQYAAAKTVAKWLVES
ncbi:MAG: UDP-N-acetylglucosamine--N-acetylmuramyl-(pentapeptide) pyrophosphoryl-undecaprenol N-acetylglucosamine transferase [Phycisphaerae bacterium]|nr:UDP-N-acetylglucosamine--N-acetylmuramyl-(pentapeptide) pyrophosphoryl-undecaprenol N-acetylglucosamine transferase [Phycisphaerae bacterium]